MHQLVLALALLTVLGKIVMLGVFANSPGNPTKKEVFLAKVNPKENPSERATVVSEHSEYSLLLSLTASTETRKLEQCALMGAAGLMLEKALRD
nr:hypothetical protein CFP56_62317 [Quercus suber]